MRAEERQALRLLISGRVQGVWYRGSMQAEAQRLGLSGWARNLADGRVEAVLEGEAAGLETIRAWAATGPAGARVDKVEVLEEAVTGLEGFEVR